MKAVKTLFMIMLLIPFFGCNGQTSKKKEAFKRNEQTATTDSVNKPKIQVNVNKRYDDKGNVLQFDSTYSYSYSSPNGPTVLKSDSIFNSFRSFYNKNYTPFFNDRNRELFLNDSLFKYDFFNDDYFLKRFELNQKVFEDMYRQMDTLKRNFLQHNYPKGYPKKTI